MFYWAWGLENCFSIQLYSFQIFFCPARRTASRSFFPPFPPDPIFLSRVFYVFLSSFFSFHSNENHLNIIVIFPSHQDSRSSLPPLFSTAAHNSHLYKMDGFFFRFFRSSTGDEMREIVVVEEFIKSNACLCVSAFSKGRKKSVRSCYQGWITELSATFHPLNMMIRLSCRFLRLLRQNTLCARRYKSKE